MMTAHVLSSTDSPGKYYANIFAYYHCNPVESKQAIEWQGQGAKKLGLTGFIKQADFKLLLQEHLPSGQNLRRMQEGELKHRPGIDITFNAPI